MKKVMFAGLSLLSLVVLMACGEEETKKTQAPEQSPKQQQQTPVQQIAVGKMLQTSPCNLWMVKKLSYLIIRGKKST